jgi:broad specificity phosphatase PhoE
MGKSKVYVVVARHGERWDYVQRDAGKGREWIQSTERPWDPPLSPIGLKQAARLGQHLSDKLHELKLPPISAVYSSPFLRCRQTACQAAEALNAKADSQKPLKVKIEYGLSESFNESWYRSWALPDSDTTWGFTPPGPRRPLHDYESHELHISSQMPVQLMLNWKEVNSDSSDVANKSDEILKALQDMEYESSTKITTEFALKTFVLVESKMQQQERMYQVLEKKAMASTAMEMSKTLLMVSHGGPVVHLYTKLTGNGWHLHGESTYCCYSLYEFDPDESVNATCWKPLIVNESRFLDFLKSDATANI